MLNRITKITSRILVGLNALILSYLCSQFSNPEEGDSFLFSTALAFLVALFCKNGSDIYFRLLESNKENKSQSEHYISNHVFMSIILYFVVSISVSSLFVIENYASYFVMSACFLALQLSASLNLAKNNLILYNMHFSGSTSIIYFFVLIASYIWSVTSIEIFTTVGIALISVSSFVTLVKRLRLISGKNRFKNYIIDIVSNRIWTISITQIATSTYSWIIPVILYSKDYQGIASFMLTNRVANLTLVPLFFLTPLFITEFSTGGKNALLLKYQVQSFIGSSLFALIVITTALIGNSLDLFEIPILILLIFIVGNLISAITGPVLQLGQLTGKGTILLVITLIFSSSVIVLMFVATNEVQYAAVLSVGLSVLNIGYWLTVKYG